MNKLLFILIGFISSCGNTAIENPAQDWSVKAYYDLLPQEMTLFYVGGVLNEVEDTLRLVLDEESRYMAYHLNYYGEDYVPFQMKLFPIEGETEPLLVINQYVWDVGDPFYQTHIIQFDETHQNYQSKMAKTTEAISGRRVFFPETAWQSVRKILDCQLEDMGYEMFPEVAFVIDPKKGELSAVLDGIEGFVDWCGLSLEEWERTLEAYRPISLHWDARQAVFSKK